MVTRDDFVMMGPMALMRENARLLERVEILERTGRAFVLAVDRRDNIITEEEMEFRRALGGFPPSTKTES